MKANVPPPVWTPARRILGNLIPAALCLPFFGLGLRELQTIRGLTFQAEIWFLAFLVVGWLAVNIFGFLGNSAMKRQLLARVRSKHALDDVPHAFVGVASSSFRSLWDPHEDIGYMILSPHELIFAGDKLSISVPREAITGFRFRPNIHTWIGIGRWISMEGAVGGETIRLLIEPREHAFVIQNMAESKRLKERLSAWLEQKSPTPYA